jgi:predicted DsbA family dithiol-disulfide isomerase
MAPPLDVQIWSDIACPWCYVGKRRFEQAVAALKGAPPPRVVWRAFELDRAAPDQYDDNPSYVERLANKYSLSTARAEAMISQMTETGASVGIEFDFGRLRAGNTFDAHQVLHLAARRDLQGAMKERLLKAYFTEGVLVSDHDELTRLGREVGLDEEEVHDTLAAGSYADQVRADEEAARELGVTGVPFFALGRYGVPGAQPPEVFAGLLAKVAEEGEPEREVSPAEGAHCGPAGCD